MIRPKIALLMPTRGRPRMAERFFQSVADTAAYPELVEVVIYVDDDDVESHGLDSKSVRVTRIIGPRLTMGEYNTRCLQNSGGDIVILVNDDMVIRTEGWDEKVRAMHASFPDGIYLAYGNDLFKGDKLCTFPILSRRTCDLLVEPFPKAYIGAFIDYHLLDIFKRLQAGGEDRIRYLADVVFEHLHYRTGKAAKDETYERRGRFVDDPVFISLIGLRRRAAERLMKAIRGERVGEYVAEVARVEQSPSVAAAIATFTRSFLLDRELPLKWRTFLWYWYLGRYLAAKGLLRPFVK